MVKIKQADIWGRVGTKFAEGLSESIPKEVENYRLAEGLKNLEREAPNLTQTQFFARAAAIPGISPETVRQFGQLAQQQNIRQNYGRNIRGTQGKGREDYKNLPLEDISKPISEMQFAPDITQKYRPQKTSSERQLPEEEIVERPIAPPMANQTGRPEETVKKGIPTESGLEPEFRPKIRWNQEQKEADVFRELEKDPSIDVSEAIRRSDLNENRYLSSPKDYQEKLDYEKNLEIEANNEFNNALETILQAEGKDVYKDISGTNKLNLQREMVNYMKRTNTPAKEAAEIYAKKALNFARRKNQLKTLANRDFMDKIIPSKKEEVRKNLKQISQAYVETGNSRELFDFLRTKNEPEKGLEGFDLSPSYAAYEAFPRSKNVQKVINSYEPTAQIRNFNKMNENNIKNANDIAYKISQSLTGKDSILAIAKELHLKNPGFDYQSFIDYFRNNQENLSPFQKEELGYTKDYWNNWGDVLYFPLNFKGD